MIIAGKICSSFTYRSKQVEIGTEVVISSVIHSPSCHSKKAFIIDRCDNHQRLVGHRICTSLVGNPNNIIAKLVKDYKEAQEFGLDVYKWIASNRLEINYSSVTWEQREKYKNMNFAEAYKHPSHYKKEENKINKKLLLIL